MSILIKGMEIPKNCTECRFACDGWCYAKEPTEPNSKSLATGTRPSWCPLIEIPPHGRLIDADAWIAKVREELLSPHSKKGALEIMGAMFRGVLDAPTIIESEGEE